VTKNEERQAALRKGLLQQATIEQRIADYTREDPGVQRERLVAFWRAFHPAAAQETSGAFKPMVCFRTRQPGERQDEPDEQWTNDTYFVTLRRHAKDPVFGSRGGMIQLGIASHDGTARHDWRDFQAIKNQLAGAECEAFELYPAEARLLDPSNYFTLWCFPGVKRLKVGHEIREIYEADVALAPQRAFPKAEEA